MKKKNVTTVEELYAAINDSANDGVTIVLAPIPGTGYVLSKDAPGAGPTRGRLDLRKNMSLIGVNGDPAAVVIDASNELLMPKSSFDMSFVGAPPDPQKTGVIRIGRGNHLIAWLTIKGNTFSVGGIAADLTDSVSKDTVISVEHVISSGSLRGLDVRNIGTGMAGRVIVAEILNNDFSGVLDLHNPKQAEAIRLANFIGADGGKIHAVMSDNTFHDSPVGCFMGNNRASFGLVEVHSNHDEFKNNEAGCVIVGAIVSDGATKSATTTFDAHASKFINNTGSFPSTSPFPKPRGGIVAVGAEILGGTTAQDNTAVLVLKSCHVKNNPNQDFEAFGARSSGSNAGTTNNKVTISLKQGNAEVVAPPPDAATPPNTVTVIHS